MQRSDRCFSIIVGFATMRRREFLRRAICIAPSQTDLPLAAWTSPLLTRRSPVISYICDDGKHRFTMLRRARAEAMACPGRDAVSNITFRETGASPRAADRIRQSSLPPAPFFVRSSSPGLKTALLPPPGCNNSTFRRPGDVSPRQIKHAAVRPNKSTFRPRSSIRARSMAASIRYSMRTSRLLVRRWRLFAGMRRLLARLS